MILLTIIIVLLSLGVAIILCAGLWGIFEKAGKQGWKAIIPGYNLAMLMEIIGLPWWSVFFMLIPIIPWVIVAFELGACFRKNKTWSFFLLVPFCFIGIPILGFGDVRFTRPVDVTRTERLFTKFLKFALYFTIIILINVIGVQIFFRFDLTDIGIYSLSNASKQAVATLQEPLTVRAFFSNDLPAEYLDLHQYVEDMLEEYAVHGGRNFNFRFYNVGGEGELTAEEETNRELAQDYGIYPVKIQIYKNDAFIYREAYMGMAIIHGDVIETIDRITAKERLEYNITTTIQKMNNKISALLALEDTIKVKLFLSSDFFSILKTLAEIPDQVERIVEELNKENYNKLEYIHIDPSKEPQIMQTESALDPKYFVAGGGENTINLYADLIVQYADKIEKYNFLELFRTPWGTQPQIADEDTLKEVLSETVTNIIDINEYIGYIADHESVRLNYEEFELQALAQTDPNINIPKITANNFKEVLSEHYTIKEINLSKNEKIPKGIECLVIAGPKGQFSDWELFQIDQFLMQGKSLAIFLDGLKEEAPQMNRQLYGYQIPKQYPPTDTGLEYLLDHYGVTVKSSYVFDENCIIQPHQVYGNLNIYFIPEIQSENINNDLPFMRNIKGLLMIQASPIELNAEKLKEQNIKADVLISSSKRSWEVSENINLDNPTAILPPSADKMQKFPLAVALEGKFESYYKGKPVPQKPKKEAEEGVEEGKPADTEIIAEDQVADEITIIEKAESPGRIFLVGTSEVIRDLILNYVPRGSLSDSSPNKILISNAIDYCNGKEDYAAMRSKLQLINPLDETKATPLAKDFTEYFNLVGLPLITILCGVIIVLLRLAQKKKLLLKFGKKGVAAMKAEEIPDQDKIGKISILSKGLKFTRDYLALVIIIGILIGGFIWINISRQMGVIRYKLPSLAILDEDTIDKFVVTSAGGSVTIEKDRNDKWRITPQGYPVDPTQASSMLEKISEIKITELISRQKQYDRYDLDENNKIHVQAYVAGTLVRELDIGKTSSTSSHTYVTLSNDENIYSIKGELKSLFNKDIPGIRDKKVMSFSTQEITELNLEFEGQIVTIKKELKEPGEGEEGTGEVVWKTDKSDKPVPEATINDILNTMGGLICEEFYTDKQKSDLEAEPFKYRIIAKGTKEYVLTIFDHPGDNKYPAFSSENDYAFNLIGWRATKMMKTLEDMEEKDS